MFESRNQRTGLGIYHRPMQALPYIITLLATLFSHSDLAPTSSRESMTMHRIGAEPRILKVAEPCPLALNSFQTDYNLVVSEKAMLEGDETDREAKSPGFTILDLETIRSRRHAHRPLSPGEGVSTLMFPVLIVWRC